MIIQNIIKKIKARSGSMKNNLIQLNKMTNQELKEKLKKLKKLLETLINTEKYYRETYRDLYQKREEETILQREAVETQIEIIENKLKNN